ncbi:MAG TPA: cytochrome-c oxidase, cbb3-type subunit I [Pseudomonadota bacterium]|nr:cytochrome-c oxidase, cbb3-type subunit I [Pseudomonadota bacterium]
MREVHITYDDLSVRRFLVASVFWGVIGMLIGLIIASQLVFHQLNLAPWFSFGRLRPLHTNAVIFAFVGNMLFAGVYYSTQRLCKARSWSDLLSSIHFWGWQLIIVGAAITLPLGYTQSKEYAELEWPLDIAIAGIWVTFGVNFFMTLKNRREKHLFVALWFYIATIVTVGILHIVNSLALPLGHGLKSYSLYSGVQDALVQWWYGHNAVAFFLTTPILGIMYYFLPKAAERPVYSYRLSIVHFWALIFMYIWAGPHHLLYTALPDWAQSMGMVFSLMLWAPSWGGMINGLLTLRGGWHKLRQDPVLKFFIAGVTFYGMATFEGPLLSIKSVSGLAHYTDWIIGHVHTGALGWNGFMAAGMFYFLVPRLWGRPLHSQGAADTHFWLATVGILLYTVSMWVSGVTQGLMWRATTEDGALLYPNFVETLLAIRPLYITRMVGGGLYLVGFILMIWNLLKTIRAGAPVVTTVTVVEPEPDRRPAPSWMQMLFSRPLILCAAALFLATAFALVESVAISALIISGMLALVVITWLCFVLSPDEDGRLHFHRLLEGRSLIFTVLVLIAVLIGGVAELLPTLIVDRAVPKTGAIATPYRPLELHGRDIYVREGCYLCHSQMVRPFRSEKLRYGDPSQAGEFIYDHPFQWGSKRTGPDLHRVGGKYSNLWHYQHLVDPRTTSPGSNMPSYAFLAERKLDLGDTALKLAAMQKLGVPYRAQDLQNGNAELQASARAVAGELRQQGVEAAWDSEIVALVAYLQRLGRHPAQAK